MRPLAIGYYAKNQRQLKFPLVKGGEPGSIELTNERIYEILNQDDIDAMKRSWNPPS